jgi:hypothetical protein
VLVSGQNNGQDGGEVMYNRSQNVTRWRGARPEPPVWRFRRVAVRTVSVGPVHPGVAASQECRSGDV